MLKQNLRVGMIWEVISPNIFILHKSELKLGENERLHGDSTMGQCTECLAFLVIVRKTQWLVGFPELLHSPQMEEELKSELQDDPLYVKIEVKEALLLCPVLNTL